MNAEAAVLKIPADGPADLESALTQVTATGRVEGLLFELAVEQRYHNRSDANIEAVYTFPLPSEAVLLDLDVRLGGRTLTGVVVGKRRAESRYEDALAQGDSAAMLERATDGMYTVSLGNLLAGEEATIRYRYAQLLRFEHGSVRVTVPTVIAPRYGDPAAAGLQPHQAPTTNLLTEHPFRLTLTLAGEIAAGTISSPTHAISTNASDKGVTVTLAERAWLDRDFVLAVTDVRATSLALLGRDGDGCVALASFCVEARQAAGGEPLALKLLVDCSGSMAGDSIAAARRALRRILGALAPTDRFSLRRFGSAVVDVVPSLIAADRDAVATATTAVTEMQADLGGTEMHAALAAAMAREGAAGAADILLITDGEVWRLDGLVGEARKARQRVFVVGIGAAPAEGVLRKLALASGGACEFVTPNEDAEDAIVRMFARLRSPRVARIDLQWPTTPQWTTPLPAGLFGGETVHVLAGFAAPPAGEARLTLVPNDKKGSTTTQVALPVDIGGDPTLARMAAMRRIEVADRTTQLDLALRYGLLTDQTNFIVVHERTEDEKARDLPELRRIAQMHAAGWGGVGSVRATGSLGMLAHRVDYDACAPVPTAPPRATSSKPRAPTVGARPAAASRGAAPLEPSVVPGSRDWMRVERSRPTPEASPFAALLAQLEHRVFFLRPDALPTTIADLEQCGLPRDAARCLRDVVAEGFAESDVVRAFLETLAPFADRAHHSRQLRRALRRQFGDVRERAELRQRVSSVVLASQE